MRVQESLKRNMIRALNIAFRTAHIASMGILLGGHAFDVVPERLMVTLWVTIGTGVVLIALESQGRPLWLHQGRGLLVMAKLVLICAVPLLWDFRLPILLSVAVVASVGSHMSGSYRYYSVIYREVIHDSYGPGGKAGRRSGGQADGG
jgi:hypothetical protein